MLALGGVVVRGFRIVRSRGNPLRHRLRSGSKACSAHVHGDQQHRADYSSRDLAAGHVALRGLHEARAFCLLAHALRCSVFDLSDLRCRLHREAWPAGVERHHRRQVTRARRVGSECDPVMPSAFTLCIIVLVALATLGLPIGLSMIGASVFYLLVAGLDLGTAAEQLLNGLFNSYVLLAVPLFILAADLM